MHDVDLQGLGETWKETRNCQDCQYGATNGVPTMERGRDSKRGKDISKELCIYMGIQDPVRQCYEWQKRNMTVESWAKNMKEELKEIGLAFI